MTVSKTDFLKGMYNAGRAMGDKAVSSDFAFEIEGFEGMWMLTKQAPWPVVSSAGEIVIPGPMGSESVQPQQAKTYQSGPISMFETRAGHVDQLLLNLIAQGAKFNAKVFAGTPDKFSAVKPLVDCFITVDSPDRDWSNRSEAMTISGTIHYHYFGETLPGIA